MKNTTVMSWLYYSSMLSLFFSHSLIARREVPLAEQDVILKAQIQPPRYKVVVYMAARNDLFPFAGRNIKQMQQIGSNEWLKIFIHFDMHKPGQQRITKRFFVEKNKLIQVGSDLSMDSGDVNSLVDCVKWAHEQDPEGELILVLWNHGMGDLEPIIQKAINPSELFSYNPRSKLIELNRTRGFLDYITGGRIEFEDARGICIDDSSGSYITNKELRRGLESIVKILKKPIAILACDACHMSSIGVVSPLKGLVSYFVGSQEVELGTGYNYTALLEPLSRGSLDPESFARHFVSCYKDTYSKITQDFTHSAINMSQIDLLEQNIDQVANVLIHGLEHQKNRSVKEAIRISRHKNFCTSFAEPTYIDLGHLYSNMLSHVHKCELTDINQTTKFRSTLSDLLTRGNTLINTVIIANTVGRNLQYAKGISIYFPELRIHKSYPQTDFALRTNWLQFLRTYLLVL
jgi:hypothetical protein